jgi:adenylate cyclase class IV
MSVQKKQFEVEIRGIITEEQFTDCLSQFKRENLRAEQDDRETTFFIIKDATLKVANLINKKSAKISFKSGDIVKTVGQQEIEIDIPQDQVLAAVNLFLALGFTETQLTHQKRFNVNVDGAEISLKWSKDWLFHFEAEIVVTDKAEIPSALERLKRICARYGLEAMTYADMESLRRRVDASHRQQPR